MKKEDLRIIFMGTPEFAVDTLKALVDNKYHVVAVITQPDKPIGRHGSLLQPSAVKQYALAQGLPVLQPEKMKDPDFVENLRSYKANLQVVVAFRMLPEVVWDMPKYGTFNVHAALLPQYRGAAPINWAIINGEKQTGVTTFFLDHDIDTGKIIMQKTFAIGPDDNVEVVYDGLMHLGAEICLETLDKIIASDGNPEAIPQSQLVTNGQTLHNAPKIFKETCKINWEQSMLQIHNFVRGLCPYPGTWTTLIEADGKETVMKIYQAATTEKQCEEKPGSIITEKHHLYVSTYNGHLLEILELQLAGKKRMKASDFLNGIKNLEEMILK
jgi:methionyl-tRNA formyltransferase